MNDSQHRPTIRPTAFWDDNGSQTAPVYQTPSETPEQKLLGDLQDAGVVIPDTENVIAAIENYRDETSLQLAAVVLSQIFARLPNGRRGMELKAALLGACEASQAEQARELNLTPQSWGETIQRLRDRIYSPKSKNPLCLAH